MTKHREDSIEKILPDDELGDISHTIIVLYSKLKKVEPQHLAHIFERFYRITKTEAGNKAAQDSGSPS